VNQLLPKEYRGLLKGFLKAKRFPALFEWIIESKRQEISANGRQLWAMRTVSVSSLLL
jgi:hypothetical protein